MAFGLEQGCIEMIEGKKVASAGLMFELSPDCALALNDADLSAIATLIKPEDVTGFAFKWPDGTWHSEAPGAGMATLELGWDIFNDRAAIFREQTAPPLVFLAPRWHAEIRVGGLSNLGGAAERNRKVS